MKKNKPLLTVLILLALGVCFFVVEILGVLKYNIACVSKTFFGISCPGCGLSRAFIFMTKLDFLSAFRMNILSIPLFFGFVTIFIFAVSDIFLKTNLIDRSLNLARKRWVIAILILLTALSWTYNLINRI